MVRQGRDRTYHLWSCKTRSSHWGHLSILIGTQRYHVARRPNVGVAETWIAVCRKTRISVRLHELAIDMDAARRVCWDPGAVHGCRANYNHLAVSTAVLARESIALCHHRISPARRWVCGEASVATRRDENDALGSRSLVEFSEDPVERFVVLYQFLNSVVIDVRRVSLDISVSQIGVVYPSSVIDTCDRWSTVHRLPGIERSPRAPEVYLPADKVTTALPCRLN